MVLVHVFLDGDIKLIGRTTASRVNRDIVSPIDLALTGVLFTKWSSDLFIVSVFMSHMLCIA